MNGSALLSGPRTFVVTDSGIIVCIRVVRMKIADAEAQCFVWFF